MILRGKQALDLRLTTSPLRQNTLSLAACRLLCPMFQLPSSVRRCSHGCLTQLELSGSKDGDRCVFRSPLIVQYKALMKTDEEDNGVHDWQC